MRRGFGAQIAYASWIVVPSSIAAVLRPSPTQPVAGFVSVVPVIPVVAKASIASEVMFDSRLLLLRVCRPRIVLPAHFDER